MMTFVEGNSGWSFGLELLNDHFSTLTGFKIVYVVLFCWWGDLSSTLQPLFHRRNVTSLSLLYHYSHGKRSIPPF